MTFRVEFAETAAADVARAYQWLSDRSPEAAARWRQSLLEAVESPSAMPQRCSLAPESDWHPRELGQLLHGKRYGTYRVIFEIRGDVVFILPVRHRAQDFLTPDELPE